ncbi:hypothetical protein F5Y19DRAFT_471398 [Xylariaceae sp. FL1651]|nr:hypothetical protein F5Y19DRAFT_471398 [Xylariaceae sp. FL1651]
MYRDVGVLFPPANTLAVPYWDNLSNATADGVNQQDKIQPFFHVFFTLPNFNLFPDLSRFFNEMRQDGKTSPARSLPGIPLVEFGGGNSRERYTSDAGSLLIKGYDTIRIYTRHGEPFCIRDFLNLDRPRVFLPMKYMEEVRNAPQENLSLLGILHNIARAQQQPSGRKFNQANIRLHRHGVLCIPSPFLERCAVRPVSPIEFPSQRPSLRTFWRSCLVLSQYAGWYRIELDLLRFGAPDLAIDHQRSRFRKDAQGPRRLTRVFSIQKPQPTYASMVLKHCIIHQKSMSPRPGQGGFALHRLASQTNCHEHLDAVSSPDFS